MALLYRSATRNLPEDFTFRGATMHDAPIVASLLYLRQSTSSLTSRVEELRQGWQTAQFNPAMDVRLILDRREHLLGYIEVWTLGLQPWLWGCVHPDYEGRGLGTALLSWAEARVCLALELLPAERRAAPRFGALHNLTTAEALCHALGWQRTRPETPAAAGALRLFEGDACDVYEKEL